MITLLSIFNVLLYALVFAHMIICHTKIGDWLIDRLKRICLQKYKNFIRRLWKRYLQERVFKIKKIPLHEKTMRFSKTVITNPAKEKVSIKH